jgi:hypothetical protein
LQCRQEGSVRDVEFCEHVAGGEEGCERKAVRQLVRAVETKIVRQFARPVT